MVISHRPRPWSTSPKVHQRLLDTTQRTLKGTIWKWYQDGFFSNLEETGYVCAGIINCSKLLNKSQNYSDISVKIAPTNEATYKTPQVASTHGYWLHYMNCYLKSKLSLKMEQYFATLDIFNIRSKFKFCISRKAEQTLLQTLAKMRNQKLNP